MNTSEYLNVNHLKIQRFIQHLSRLIHRRVTLLPRPRHLQDSADLSRELEYGQNLSQVPKKLTMYLRVAVAMG